MTFNCLKCTLSSKENVCLAKYKCHPESLFLLIEVLPFLLAFTQPKAMMINNALHIIGAASQNTPHEIPATQYLLQIRNDEV